MDGFRRSLSHVVLTAVAAQAGCGRSVQTDEPVVLATGVSLWGCAADERTLYGDAEYELVRISRTTGHVDYLTHAQGMVNLVALDGAAYWIDRWGIERWKEGDVHPTTLVPVIHWHSLESLVRFRDRVCWNDINHWHPRALADTVINCFDPATGSTTHFATPPGLVSELMVVDQHLYVSAEVPTPGASSALGGSSNWPCQVWDYTDPDAPILAAQFSTLCVGMISTVRGVGLAFDGQLSVRDQVLTVRGANPRVFTIRGRSWMWSHDGLAQLDPFTGWVGPVIAPPSDAACVDRNTMFYAGPDHTVLSRTF